ncbi:MAG: aspartate ammonia-lyase [Planctomycetia bacterium]|jgi:aspartate ammonia-lyase
MENYRKETDLLGTKNVPKEALWGIHTLRAAENFPIADRPVSRRLVHAYGLVKLAAARVNHELGHLDDDRFAPIETACREMADGQLDSHIIVDALQGGAGTSTNMNVNEVLANRALTLAGRQPGEYDYISPHDHLNLHQSTNDTYPTALKVAAIRAVRELEQKVIRLTDAFQAKEKEFASIVKIGRTEMQDAVLTTFGRSMAAMAEPLARDRWRIYKCEERLRTVNLGGTAIGTGLAAPRRFIFRAVDTLREITGIGLARAENLVEATQNADVFVEVSGILKALATTLLKICTDLRLLSSGPDAGLGELRLPAVQAGSSIMPGKINPVIPEAVSQVAMTVLGNDQVIAHAAASGNLELNAFLPLIADRLLDTLDLLIAACDTLAARCIEGLEANADQCRAHVESSTATITALVGQIGYDQAELLLKQASLPENRGCSIRELAIASGLVTAEQFDELTTPEAVNRLGK